MRKKLNLETLGFDVYVENRNTIMLVWPVVIIKKKTIHIMAVDFNLPTG